jgi:multiple sugar transport system permease protein
VLSFRENWDQFLWPLVIVSREALKTFPLGLALFEGSFNASYHEMMAAAVVGMIPMMVLFLVFQRAFIRGLTLTGLKE